jgi:hypothetical protein
MAVYKIFPTQDTTLYSAYPVMNTGLDAILEASNKLGLNGNPEVARYLIQFDQNEIQDIIFNKISGSSYDVYLKNFIAEAQGLNQSTALEILPIAQPWNNGTGYYLDNPQEQDGASWAYSNYSGSGPWNPSGSYSSLSSSFNYTSSFNLAYGPAGGGNWFYDTSGNLYVSASYNTPSSVLYAGNSPFSGSNLIDFQLRDTKDIEVNVTKTTKAWSSGSIPNYGFIIKLTGSQEFNPSKFIQPIFKYYSVDTNTIYPPELEFRWRDYSTILTGSATSSIVDTVDIKMSLSENPGVFYPSSINRFYINVSPLYPARVYQTSSLYTDLNYLPTKSHYAVKDLDTNEFVINFDEQYTQISSDEDGNYFDLYMSGFEPERYYQILIKTNIKGSTIIFDDYYYFKVVNE